MNDDKNTNGGTHTNKNQALFIECRVVRIGKQQSVVIGEGGFSFVEGYAMLSQVT